MGKISVQIDIRAESAGLFWGNLQMKKKIAKRISICLMSSMLVFSSVPGTVQAHSGRTDSSGGHHDNKNVSGLGSYHYHCGGNPPHLHDGGVCPYSSAASAAVVSTSSASGSVSFSGEIADSSAAAAASAATNTIKLSTGASITISKDMIKVVQDVLNRKGYDCGTADGVAGNKTKESLRKYLDDHKESDGADNVFLELVAEGIGVQ